MCQLLTNSEHHPSWSPVTCVLHSGAPEGLGVYCLLCPGNSEVSRTGRLQASPELWPGVVLTA